MAEIDLIIIESLKNLHCEFDDDITSLKQFEADLIVLAISTCLEAIIPNSTFPKKLPPTMSMKLKIASDLAQQVKDLGFRGDMGYQTILYCNEVEIRRVLMFLIERLPIRETNKSVTVEEIGYVPQLVKEIEKKLQLSLKQMWLPSNVLRKGCRKLSDDTFIVNSFGESSRLETENLIIPNTREIVDDALQKSGEIHASILEYRLKQLWAVWSDFCLFNTFVATNAPVRPMSTSACARDAFARVIDHLILSAMKQYYIRIVPDVTKQCNSNNNRKLIPSLLFKDNEFNFDRNLLKIPKRNLAQISTNTTELDETQNNLINEIIVNDTSNTNNNNNSQEENVEIVDKIQMNIKQLADEQFKFKTLKEDVRNYEIKLAQINKMKTEEDERLKSSLSRIKIKSKTLAILSKEENLIKLKTLVENGSERLIDLTNQWNQVQTPLLEQYKSLQNSITNDEMKFQNEQTKITKLRENYQNLIRDLKEKEHLEEQLKLKLEQINKNHNRSNYTKRILEIINNIKKQNEEIQKILKDTKSIQKDINTLTGQVDRSFTLSDELIFHDAKNDETARKAYKLLAALRDECGNIIKAVTDLGLTERESRNLQEQVDTEKAKEIGGKLERVENDLKEIIKDTEILIAN